MDASIACHFNCRRMWRARFNAPRIAGVMRTVSTNSNAVVWDRACVGDPNRFELPGDRALASMLRMHGLIMNGGLHHALDVLTDEELAAALAGFKYFEIEAVLEIIEKVLADPSLREWSDINERTVNELYFSVSADDELLVEAFDKRYAISPDDFTDA